MIKIFNNFTDLTFPITTCKKYKRLESTSSTLVLGNISLTKHGNLFSTFNLALDELPKTYITFPTPELFLMNLGSIYKKIIIDDKLNVFIPINKIKITFSTFEPIQTNQFGRYILVKEIPYPIPLAKEKGGFYAFLACVDGLYFHAGWSNERITYDFFI